MADPAVAAGGAIAQATTESCDYIGCARSPVGCVLARAVSSGRGPYLLVKGWDQRQGILFRG